MDELGRLRQILDYNPCLPCYAPNDAWQEYYCSVCARLTREVAFTAGAPALFGEPGLAAAMITEGPRVEERPAAAVPFAGPEPSPEPEPAPEPEPLPAAQPEPEPEPGPEPEPEPLPTPPLRALAAAPLAAAEVELVPLNSPRLPGMLEPNMVAFEEVWTEPLPGSLAEAATPPGPAPSELPAAYAPRTFDEVPETPAPELPLPAAEPLRVGEYTLFAKQAQLRGGPRIIYFFAREPPQGAAASALPAGYEVRTNPRSKLPYLRKERTGRAAKRGARAARRTKRAR